MEDPYVYRGWSYDAKHALRPKSDQKLYDKEDFVRLYERQVTQVKQYFAHRSEDLLVLDVAQSGAYEQLCDFLGQEPIRNSMPWKNKTLQ